ncbi:hypothetical protein Sinac_6166 [Singulisphaera acidiphila DSM 18658]|uniref:Uncharacterized protein n=1 Tax=Singulisphaera acidiphila (strain ATCC BAA-1392 / DSM 18658 / VKM B-2454 / MOB10) TaxID=886293 RepID=L0DNK1_SINAD|nr:hypothetical protein Sinac_6166 [Singulisphaera acidiphila DSM 18658]
MRRRIIVYTEVYICDNSPSLKSPSPSIVEHKDDAWVRFQAGLPIIATRVEFQLPFNR